MWAHNAYITVYENDLITGPHLCVKVTVGDQEVCTHQIPIDGPPDKKGTTDTLAKVEPFTAGLWGGDNWIQRESTIRVSDVEGINAQAFQRAEILRSDSGKYQVNVNDCLTHVVDVLRAAGQPLPAPVGNTDHVKSLLKHLRQEGE